MCLSLADVLRVISLSPCLVLCVAYPPFLSRFLCTWRSFLACFFLVKSYLKSIMKIDKWLFAQSRECHGIVHVVCGLIYTHQIIIIRVQGSNCKRRKKKEEAKKRRLERVSHAKKKIQKCTTLMHVFNMKIGLEYQHGSWCDKNDFIFGTRLIHECFWWYTKTGDDSVDLMRETVIFYW